MLFIYLQHKTLLYEVEYWLDGERKKISLLEDEIEKLKSKT
jgi:hypothetical protein